MERETFIIICLTYSFLSLCQQMYEYSADTIQSLNLDSLDLGDKKYDELCQIGCGKFCFYLLLLTLPFSFSFSVSPSLWSLFFPLPPFLLFPSLSFNFIWVSMLSSSASSSSLQYKKKFDFIRGLMSLSNYLGTLTKLFVQLFRCLWNSIQSKRFTKQRKLCGHEKAESEIK